MMFEGVAPRLKNMRKGPVAELWKRPGFAAGPQPRYCDASIERGLDG